MLVLRLKPIGKKKQVSFRIVVAEKRSKLDGRFIDDLGFYNPQTKKSGVNAERLRYWLSQGVQPSPTVHNILVGSKILEGEKIAIKINKPKIENKAEVTPVAEAVAETPAVSVSPE